MANILVVDDDDDNRNFLVTFLRRQGHQLQEAARGEAALAITRAQRPDLVITDVLMPEMDGYEFARQLRADAAIAHTRIIFYTASYYRASARALAEACGVNRVLAKPSELAVILEAVESVLREPAVEGAPVPRAFDQEHARVLTEKIFDQLEQLELANESLRASESQYRALFETNPFPMWIVDEKSHRFLAVNHAAVRHYGYSPEEFEQNSLTDVLPAADSAAHEGPGVTGLQKHRTKAGDLIDVAVFTRETSFEGMKARLELVQDVTARNLAEQKLRESQEQLQRLTVRLRSAQEEERTRVARYLHDELGQMLTALRMTCAWMKARVPEGQVELAEKMQSCLKLTDEMVVAVQRLSTELRPGILDLGIAAAIDWYAREFETRSDIACFVDVPEDEEPMDPKCATEMYRILQEALTNVARHSGATRVHITLKREPDALTLEVSDNGRGITPAEIGSRSAIGLLGMRERAALIGGTVSIDGGITPGKPGGTTVRLITPTHSES